MPRDLGTRPGEAGGSGQAAWTEISPGRGKSFLIASHLFTEEELPQANRRLQLRSRDFSFQFSSGKRARIC